MEGYIKSLSTGWRHIFKRSVRPGGTIPLSELFEVYGKKHQFKSEEDFVEWLKVVKLKGEQEFWEISLINEVVPKFEEKDEDDEEDDKGPRKRGNNFSIEEIVNLSVRKARDVVPTITDVNLLKYALQEARPRANKDSLCRLIEKRIRDVQAGI